jgi:molybdenum cofactor synthesis domain-containing protein
VTTAAALIIGDEILSGKVRDTNAPLLIDLLSDLGVELRRVAYVSDEIGDIAAEVVHCAHRFDAVITSGGVGPTHDDRTVEAVARAFGVAVVRNPEIASMIQQYWGDRLTESALSMADVPEGAKLLHSGDSLLPIVVIRNVYLLPGVPRLFEIKLRALREVLRGTPHEIRHLYLNSDESGIASLLRQVDGEFRDVKIGSYPRFHDATDYRLWITIEAERPDDADDAVDRLLELLPSGEVVRVVR